jgi:ABC-type transport system substrate-binding protein
VDAGLYTNYRDGGWTNSLITFLQANSLATDPGQSYVRHMSSKGTRYVSMIRPPDYEAKLAQAQAEPDSAKREPLLKEITRLIVDDYSIVNYGYLANNFVVMNPEVQDTRLYYPHFQQWSPEDAKLVK